MSMGELEHLCELFERHHRRYAKSGRGAYGRRVNRASSMSLSSMRLSTELLLRVQRHAVGLQDPQVLAVVERALNWSRVTFDGQLPSAPPRLTDFFVRELAMLDGMPRKLKKAHKKTLIRGLRNFADCILVVESASPR